MKIRYEPSPSLQRGEMQNYIASKPQLSRDEAIIEWLELKYRSWINDRITTNLVFESRTDEPVHIDLTFAKTKDGQLFYSQMGGRIIG